MWSEELVKRQRATEEQEKNWRIHKEGNRACKKGKLKRERRGKEEKNGLKKRKDLIHRTVPQGANCATWSKGHQYTLRGHKLKEYRAVKAHIELTEQLTSK